MVYGGQRRRDEVHGEWSVRPAPTYEENIANVEAVLRAFSKWSVPDGVTINAFVAKAEGPHLGTSCLTAMTSRS